MKNELKYVADISKEMFEKENVLPFINEDGKLCILIRNSKTKINSIRGSTDNLEYHLNSVFYKDEKPYYFHMISCLNSDEYSKEQFKIAYDYLFKSLKEPKSDFDIGSLINSLEQLFKVTPEKDLFKVQTGIYGELLFVLFQSESGAKQLLTKYHSNFFSKHDLELDRKNRIEIKSTVGTKRIHHFSHDQLVRQDINVYVGSLLFEESSEGVSLNELFDKILELSEDPKMTLWLGQLKGFCGVSKQNPGVTFDFEKAKKEIRTFRADELPHLNISEVNGVSNISYDVDCSLGNDIDNKEFIDMINYIISNRND